MLWLYDSTGVLTSVVTEFETIETRERYREHSEWTGRFSLSAKAALDDAYFAVVADEPEVYLVQRVETETGLNQGVIASGLSASALLSIRTIAGTKTWNGLTAGAMIANMMADFTGARAIHLTFGTGSSIGSAFSMQRSWGDAGVRAIEILAAQDLGMRTRLDGTSVMLDVFALSDTGLLLGEVYGDGSTARQARDDKPWKNYAYVLGEGVGAARVQVIVDQTGGAERRELYVDASDLQKGTLTDLQYQALLTARGASKLAEARRIDTAKADGMTAPVRAGDVIWYDSSFWQASYPVTEVITTREGSKVRRSPVLGEPTMTMQRMIRRQDNG